MTLLEFLGIVGSILIPMFTFLGWIYSRIDKRFDKIDDRFNRVEEKISNLDTRISRIEGVLSVRENWWEHHREANEK